jgi:hypothetical protein
MFFISTQLANPGLDVREVRRRLAPLERLDQPIRFIFGTAACVDGVAAYYDEMVWTRTLTRTTRDTGHFRLYVFLGVIRDPEYPYLRMDVLRTLYWNR